MTDGIRTTRTRDEGFAVVAVLVILALMLSLGFTYMQHTALAAESSPAGRDMVQAGEDVESGFVYAQAALESGSGTGTTSVAIGDRNVSVRVTELGTDGHMRWDLVCTDGNALGSTLVAESTRVAAATDEALGHPDLLPALEGSVLTTLLTDPDVSIIAYSGDVTLSDQELSGILVLEDGATLTVRDVVLHGAVVSREALEGDAVGAFDPATAPELIIDGPFLVTSGDDLTDLAVLMPDGILSTAGGLADSFQFLGAVVAHTINLAGVGVIDGSVAFASMTLADTVERPGHGREPLAMPDILDPGSAWTQSSFAVLPLNQTADELTGAGSFWESLESGGAKD